MKYYVMNGSCIVILSKIQIILNSEKYSEAQEFQLQGCGHNQPNTVNVLSVLKLQLTFIFFFMLSHIFQVFCNKHVLIYHHRNINLKINLFEASENDLVSVSILQFIYHVLLCLVTTATRVFSPRCSGLLNEILHEMKQVMDGTLTWLFPNCF